MPVFELELLEKGGKELVKQEAGSIKEAAREAFFENEDKPPSLDKELEQGGVYLLVFDKGTTRQILIRGSEDKLPDSKDQFEVTSDKTLFRLVTNLGSKAVLIVASDYSEAANQVFPGTDMEVIREWDKLGRVTFANVPAGLVVDVWWVSPTIVDWNTRMED